MTPGDWNDVIRLALKLVSHEHPFAQAMIYEGTAFAVVMFVEGMRANFWPRRLGREEREMSGSAPLGFPPKAAFAKMSRSLHDVASTAGEPDA